MFTTASDPLDTASGLSSSLDADMDAAIDHPALQAAIKVAIADMIDRRRRESSATRIRRPYPKRQTPNYMQSPTGKQLQHWLANRNDRNELPPRLAKAFRARYRVPFQTFLVLVSKARNVYGLDSRAKYRTRTTYVPLQLLVLCSLRILGRGSSPHDDSDHTSISSNTIRLFFHRFCAAIVKHESAEWLSAPTTVPEIRRAVALYAQEGFVGCLGSTDGVHISYDRCPAALRSGMVGKEGIPTVAYEVTVRHDRWIMHATRGFPGAWNDKSMSRYDSFLGKVRDVDGLYANIEFTVHTSLTDTTETATVRGLYLIVDGGFHQWKCLQCPFREASDKWGIAWTEKLMSLRKDVECTFGILKKRFRILKIPQLWTADHPESPTLKLDNVFHTCCILHNMLLREDGNDFLDPAHSDLDQQDPARLDAAWPMRSLGAKASLFLTRENTGDNDFMTLGLPRLSTAVQTDAGHSVLRNTLIRHFGSWPRPSTWAPYGGSAAPYIHTGWQFNAAGLVGT
jgi:hypothetical protein